MFYSFKPERQPRSVKDDLQTDQLAKRIAARLLKLQRRCADLLAEKTKALSAKSLRALLIMMAIGAGSYSLFLIVNGFLGTATETVSLGGSIQLPSDQDALLRKKQSQALHAYLDSLQKAFVSDSIAASNHSK